MKLPQPIPYQGSKRRIAPLILRYFPGVAGTLVEPFAGSAAVSIAAAYNNKASSFWLNDINAPLMRLIERIIDEPREVAADYEELWKNQIGKERFFYNEVRAEFNRNREPHYLLFLLARCVKASVRYNSKGDFNQSPDNRRKGRMPSNMRGEITRFSRLLKGKVRITTLDYREVLDKVRENDLVYIDPPYQGICGGCDPRYASVISSDRFLEQLRILSEKRIRFILSYDGRMGEIKYGRELPDDLGLHRIEIEVGRSAQATLLGKNHTTYESIYLSGPLLDELRVLRIPVKENLKYYDNRQMFLIKNT